MVSLLDWPPVEVARQLCLIQQRLLSSISARSVSFREWYGMFMLMKSRELLGTAWTKHRKHVTSPNVSNLWFASTDFETQVVAAIARFNTVTSWVATQVLRYKDRKQRAKSIEVHWIWPMAAHVLQIFIHIAHHSMALHDYETAMQLHAGLRITSIARLTRSWEVCSGVLACNLTMRW